MADGRSGSKKRPRPNISETTGAVVCIEVADTKAYIHKELLTYHSGYFSKVLNGSFKEAAQQILDLTHVSVTTFASFVDWLYTQKLVVHEPDESAKDDPNRGMFADYDKKSRELIDVYIFEDGHDVPELRRCAIDTLFRHWDRSTATKMPSYKTVTYEFLRLPEGSLLRKLMVDVEC